MLFACVLCLTHYCNSDNCFVSVDSGNDLYFLQKLSVNVNRPPETLDDLRVVLTAFGVLKSISMDVELRYLDIAERYRTLAMYNIPVSARLIKPFRSQLRAQMPRVNEEMFSF